VESSNPSPADQAQNERATSFLERARLRRRLTYLRRRRELLLRELGGRVVESHRQGHDDPGLAAMLSELDALDDERSKLERGLAEHQELAVLREPGITTCPQCSTIHSSDANFCPGCGTKRTRRRPARKPAAA